MRLHAPIVRLANPFKFWTGTLIGAVITSCQSKAAVCIGKVAKFRFGLRRSYFGSLWTENIADIVIGRERSHIDPVFEKRFIGSSSTGFGKSLIFQLFVD